MTLRQQQPVARACLINRTTRRYQPVVVGWFGEHNAFLKEPLGCCCIASSGEQKIDAGTRRVHRPLQIRPYAFYADVSFIDTPALVSRLQV